MRSFILSVFLCFSLTACAANLRHYSSIDQSDKTITVPTGGSGLRGPIKDALRADGWHLVVSKGPSVTEGTMGQNTNLRHYDTAKTRYTLIGEETWVDYCLTGSGMYRYDISIIDNKSGEEALTLDGMGCGNDVANKLVNALSQ